ncbi:hypothetical protein H0H93_001737, partial [Arthromyces matolae]
MEEEGLSDKGRTQEIFEELGAQEDFEVNDLVYISLPSARDVDCQTQCLIRRPALKAILARSAFPQNPEYPEKTSFRIGPSCHGLGMFATQNLSLGDLILTERPLTLTPTVIPMPTFSATLESQGITGEARNRSILNRWENVYLRPCFERLDAKQQAEFLDLANAHQEDGSGPLLGVIRTNGLEVGTIVDTEPQNGSEYAAVCKIMSRINHSCRPSADRFFDPLSFSFQLRAARSIKAGEEIFISYYPLLEPSSFRQKHLAYYGIVCSCHSCLPPTLGSDARRVSLRGSIDAIDVDFNLWMTEARFADDFTIKISLRWIEVIEEEGVEASMEYFRHLRALVLA